MIFDQFIKATFGYWSQYLNTVSKLISENQVYVDGGGKALYPTILLCTETKNFFIAELIGASPNYQQLTVKRHKECSIDRYFNQFDTHISDPVIKIDNGKNHRFENIMLAQQSDKEQVEKRFPFVKFARWSGLHRIGGKGTPVLIGENSLSATFLNCILINTHNEAVRVKNILYMTVINKSLSKPRYLEELPSKITWGDNLIGVSTCSNEVAEGLVLAGHFSNLFLMNKLHETTIGEFLKTHPEILKRALGAKKFITEAFLPWIEKADFNNDNAINPDLLIEREDGYYDIYDLKTAALDKISLTKGKRARRRFIDYVSEGIAQLANYKEYFNYPANQKLAWDKYQIKINNPKLVLVVGSFENSNYTEIEEACRPYKDVITVIDYDTLMQLLIRK